MLIEEGFEQLANGLWFYPYGNFLVLQTNGLSSYNGNVFREVSFSSKVKRIDRAAKDAKEREMEDFLLAQLPMENIKVTKCNRLEDSGGNFEITITVLGNTVYRYKTRYVFRIPSVSGNYVSNYWFEKIYADLDKEVKLKCKLCMLAANPSNHMEMRVFCPIFSYLYNILTPVWV